MAAPAPDVARDDPNWIAFWRTPRVCDFFNANAIHFGAETLLPDSTGQVAVSKAGRIEQYTLFAGDFAHAMGAFSYNHSPIRMPSLTAGRYCSIGNHLRIMGERHPLEWVTTSNITYCFRPDWNKPNFMRAHRDLMHGRWTPLAPADSRPDPVLQHDVWVAEAVTLARGITVGTGAVIGAAAVVTKDVEPYMIVAGNPARPVRRRFADALCDRLLQSRWWDAHPDALFRLDSTNPDTFLDQLDEARASNAITPCPVAAFTWRDMVQAISAA